MASVKQLVAIAVPEGNLIRVFYREFADSGFVSGFVYSYGADRTSETNFKNALSAGGVTATSTSLIATMVGYLWAGSPPLRVARLTTA